MRFSSFNQNLANVNLVLKVNNLLIPVLEAKSKNTATWRQHFIFMKNKKTKWQHFHLSNESSRWNLRRWNNPQMSGNDHCFLRKILFVIKRSEEALHEPARWVWVVGRSCGLGKVIKWDRWVSNNSLAAIYSTGDF